MKLIAFEGGPWDGVSLQISEGSERVQVGLWWAYVCSGRKNHEGIELWVSMYGMNIEKETADVDRDFHTGRCCSD